MVRITKKIGAKAINVTRRRGLVSGAAQSGAECAHTDSACQTALKACMPNPMSRRQVSRVNRTDMVSKPVNFFGKKTKKL